MKYPPKIIIQHRAWGAEPAFSIYVLYHNHKIQFFLYADTKAKAVRLIRAIKEGTIEHRG